MELDHNATNFIKQAFSFGGSPSVFNKFPVLELGNLYVPWNCERVSEIANGSKISEHEWDKKQEKFSFFKDKYLGSSYNELTIFTVRSAPDSPMLIIDGVHRSIGIYSACLADSSIADKTNIVLVLFESLEITNMHDYKNLIANCN